MNYYNRKTAALIDSTAMRATAMDSLSDSIATTVVLLATLIGKYTNLHIDGICGMLVGCFILYAGIKAANETLSPLLGQPPSPEFVAQIEKIVLSAPYVCGMHDLIVHDYGPGRVMISLHAEVPADQDILVIHDAIDNVEVLLKKTLHCDATIHMDPVMTDDPLVNELREKVAVIIKKHSEIISFHDFRIVKGPTHTNLVFDILLPMNCETPENELLHAIRGEIKKQIGKTYFAVIQIDRSYSQ
jgi:divalent metal cation (Fe/Co/Zn/Cd) transporter